MTVNAKICAMKYGLCFLSICNFPDYLKTVLLLNNKNAVPV